MIHVEVYEDHRGGQIRDYGPNVWSGTINYGCSYPGMPSGWHPPVNGCTNSIHNILRVLVTSFADPGEGDWHSPRLTEFIEMEPGMWRYRIERPWDD